MTNEEKIFCYAEIDLQSICFNILQTPEEITLPTMIAVDAFDMKYLGMKYVDGEWVEYIPEPRPEPEQEPTAEELIDALIGGMTYE